MTVWELKERLEILIMDDKGDYVVFVDDTEDYKDEYVIYVNDKDREVYL